MAHKVFISIQNALKSLAFLLSNTTRQKIHPTPFQKKSAFFFFYVCGGGVCGGGGELSNAVWLNILTLELFRKTVSFSTDSFFQCKKKNMQK